jgi:hypothetical protein
MIAAIPKTAVANSVVGGIRNSVAGDGAVKATMKNAIAQSDIASLRRHTNAISYLLLLSESSTRARRDNYSECDARCSASHCSLIQPRLAAFRPPGTRIHEMPTIAINTMTTPTMSSMWFFRWQVFRGLTIVTGAGASVCALVHKASGA